MSDALPLEVAFVTPVVLDNHEVHGAPASFSKLGQCMAELLVIQQIIPAHFLGGEGSLALVLRNE